MSRILRLALAVVSTVGAGVVFAAPTPAATTVPAWVLVVNCADSSPTSSGDFWLPVGLYSATVVGACEVATMGTTGNQAVTTPCSVVGPTPCVGASVQNLPEALCWTTVGGITTRQCGPSNELETTTGGCWLTVTVNSQCLSNGTGLVTHGGGPVTAVFNDGFWSDNVGAFVVTIRPVI